MRLVSVNVGRPREVLHEDAAVRTGIFKQPVAGGVRVRALNLDGDEQADLAVHGGPYKAVYAYAAEHYGYWRGELPEMDLPWGMFGENLTTEGLKEEEVRIGDCFRIGSAELRVTQPRLPCFKLGIRFGRPDIVRRFLASGRTGFYLAVIEEGELGAGDAIELLDRDPSSLSVLEVTRLYVSKQDDREAFARAASLEALSPSWREHFQKRIAGEHG